MIFITKLIKTHENAAMLSRSPSQVSVSYCNTRRQFLRETSSETVHHRLQHSLTTMQKRYIKKNKRKFVKSITLLK